MFQYVCLAISVLSLLLGVGLCLALCIRGKKDAKRPHLSPLGALISGTSVAMFALYLVGNVGASGGWADTIITSLLGTIRAMTGENSVFDTRSAFGTVPAALTAEVAVYTAVLHLLSAALLLGVILSLLKSVFPKLRYHLFSRGRLCVFSVLSERSLLLAEDIRACDEQTGTPPSVIVFLRRPAIGSEDSAQNLERMHRLGGFLFATDLSELVIPKNCKKEQTDFFLLADHETENLREALELERKYRSCSHPIKLYVSNTTPEAAALLDAIKWEASGHLSMRLVSETRAMLYHLADTKPFFLGAKENKLSILVVGAGRVGIEAVKLACWCAQTFRLQPELLVVDSDPLAERRFAKDCPELAAEAAPPDAIEDCSVRFFTTDVTTADFTDFLRQHTEIGYVICALGDEALNLRIGMKIRSCFEIHAPTAKEQMPDLPIINVLVNDPFLYEKGRELKFDLKIACGLNTFGSLKEIYTQENITNLHLEQGGYQVHSFYCTYFPYNMTEAAIRQEYDQKEYNRASSMASALHAKYKAYACFYEDAGNVSFNWSKPLSPTALSLLERQLSDVQMVEKLAVLEHRRWNAYMRTQGWRHATRTDVKGWYRNLKDHRCFSARLHPCLVGWDALTEVNKWLLEDEQWEKEDFQETDRCLVRKLPLILAAIAGLSEYARGKEAQHASEQQQPCSTVDSTAK